VSSLAVIVVVNRPCSRRSARQQRRYNEGEHLVRQEIAETIHLNETLGAPSERAVEKLFAAIEAEEEARAPRRRPRRGHQRPVCPDHVAGCEGS
jgi:hypothetical protein